jgi:phosphatidylethanolamine-binding protein (PEBP) family uncharacterized protein
MFKVSYGLKIVSGQALTKSNTQTQPSVFFKGESNTLYTLIMSDPDAPKADWLHWLVVNNDGRTRQEIVQYEAPAPPSGTHRYIFYLCAQKSPLHVNNLPRSSFNTQQFIKDNKLRIVKQVQFTTSA